MYPGEWFLPRAYKAYKNSLLSNNRWNLIEVSPPFVINLMEYSYKSGFVIHYVRATLASK